MRRYLDHRYDPFTVSVMRLRARPTGDGRWAFRFAPRCAAAGYVAVTEQAIRAHAHYLPAALHESLLAHRDTEFMPTGWTPPRARKVVKPSIE